MKLLGFPQSWRAPTADSSLYPLAPCIRSKTLLAPPSDLGPRSFPRWPRRAETLPLTLVLCLRTQARHSHLCKCKTQDPYHPLVLARARVGSLRPHSITDLRPRALPSPHLPGPRHSSRSSASAVRARTVGRAEEAAMAAAGGQEGDARTASRRARGLGEGGQGRRQAGAPYIPAGAGPAGRAPSQRAAGQAAARSATEPRAPCTPLTPTAAPRLQGHGRARRRAQGKGWGDGLPGPSSGFSPAFPSGRPGSRTARCPPFPLRANAALPPHPARSRARGPAPALASQVAFGISFIPGAALKDAFGGAVFCKILKDSIVWIQNCTPPPKLL